MLRHLDCNATQKLSLGGKKKGFRAFLRKVESMIRSKIQNFAISSVPDFADHGNTT